jgi:hypothetical protein
MHVALVHTLLAISARLGELDQRLGSIEDAIYHS